MKENKQFDWRYNCRALSGSKPEKTFFKEACSSNFSVDIADGDAYSVLNSSITP